MTTPHNYSSKNNLTLIGNKFVKQMVKNCPKIDKTCVETSVDNSHLKNWLVLLFIQSYENQISFFNYVFGLTRISQVLGLFFFVLSRILNIILFTNAIIGSFTSNFHNPIIKFSFIKFFWHLKIYIYIKDWWKICNNFFIQN